MTVELKATMEKKVSKSGREYVMISIPLSDRYNKKVFLDDCEIALVEKTFEI